MKMGLSEMSSCGKCIKYLLFVSNFLVFVTSFSAFLSDPRATALRMVFGGLVVLAIGGWSLTNHAHLQELLGHSLYSSSSWILVATGIVVTLISFLGCVGALKEIKCMLLMYFILLFGIFVTMFVGGILGFVFQEKVTDKLRMRMFTTVKEYGSNSATTEAWDAVQKTLGCCGVEGADGYKVWKQESAFIQRSNDTVPASCCRPGPGGTFLDCKRQPTNTTAYLKGCLTEAVVVFQNQAVIIGGVGVGIAFIMLLGMILSMALFKAII